ncbi:hypothetical protein K443DRAFT_92393, partial [Laccaria amethystina LaAM-08-1]
RASTNGRRPEDSVRLVTWENLGKFSIAGLCEKYKVRTPISWYLTGDRVYGCLAQKWYQKLIACDAVLEETSLVSLATAWMALIHEVTCNWKELRNALSVSSFDEMSEILGR